MKNIAIKIQHNFVVLTKNNKTKYNDYYKTIMQNNVLRLKPAQIALVPKSLKHFQQITVN